MTHRWPRILSRETISLSPWMDVIVRHVEFSPDDEPQVYHAIGQPDYLAVVAVTPDGRIPIVSQYRPALEAFSLELPAGLLDDGEDPASGSARELLEETGYPALRVQSLGATCTGRLSNRIHSYYVETGDQIVDFCPEVGVSVILVSPSELVALIKAGKFREQLHLGTLLQAELQGWLTLPR